MASFLEKIPFLDRLPIIVNQEISVMIWLLLLCFVFWELIVKWIEAIGNWIGKQVDRLLEAIFAEKKEERE